MNIFNSKWTYLVLALIGAVGFVYALLEGDDYIKEHPLYFTVIDKTEPIIARKQYKGSSELFTQQWIRIRYDLTNVTYDFDVENPFIAKSYVIGGHYTWEKPLIRNYSDAKYEYPWYISSPFVCFCGVIMIMSLCACMVISDASEHKQNHGY
jgi:hypothetical protein